MTRRTWVCIALMPLILCLGIIIGSHITQGRMEQTVAALKAENDIKAAQLGNEIRNLNGQVDKLMEFLTMEGVASFYSYPFHGRPTASGKIFDKNKLTAAHRSLVFGTFWLVKNNLNGKSIVVEITDRGPFIPGRILDLSEAAALALNMRERGLCRVMIEPAIRPGTGD